MSLFLVFKATFRVTVHNRSSRTLSLPPSQKVTIANVVRIIHPITMPIQLKLLCCLATVVTNNAPSLGTSTGLCAETLVFFRDSFAKEKAHKTQVVLECERPSQQVPSESNTVVLHISSDLSPFSRYHADQFLGGF